MGIEEKRVAHGTEMILYTYKKRGMKVGGDADAHCSIWLGAMSREK